jgi:large conductance mechanosensitive channel protein
MGLIGDFKQFLLRGNVVDLAVAVVIGVAFAAVVTSLVENLLTPLIADSRYYWRAGFLRAGLYHQ